MTDISTHACYLRLGQHAKSNYSACTMDKGMCIVMCLG